MQIFLDFANFYRRFIYNYSIIIVLFISLFKDSKINKKLRFLE